MFKKGDRQGAVGGTDDNAELRDENVELREGGERTKKKLR